MKKTKLSLLLGLILIPVGSFCQSLPLQEVLNEKGMIRPGITSGSFDARGYAMQLAPDGSPSFSKAVEDSNWDARFYVPGGLGLNARCEAIAVSGSNLYIGGRFTTAGGDSVYRIAMWDGSGWSTLGSGMNYYVYALAVDGGNLYAGGNFTTAGGVSTNYIAKWDGSSWSALGSGMDNVVRAIVISDSGLYAGGDFTTAGGVSAKYIAKWNGSTWSALGSTSLNGQVATIAVKDNNVYVGGYGPYVTKWNGSSWSALGGSFSSYVYALAISGSDLYAGGHFTSVGGVSTQRIAKWNGTNWSPLGSGMSYDVFALAFNNNDLYVGGYFTTAGGISANYIAKWNGSSWSTLGSGMSQEVYALAVSGNAVNVGGNFTSAGGKASVCFGIYHLPPIITYNTPDSGANNVALNALVKVAFSEPIDTASFTFTILPDPGDVIGTWNTKHDTLSILHANFAYATAETISITHAENLSGALLSGRSVITFTTLANQGPVITMKTQPTNPRYIAGPYLVQAVIKDPAKKGGKTIAADSLYYRVSGGGWSGAGASGVMGDTFSFQIPAIDSGLVEYYLQAWDNMGLTALAPPSGYYSFHVDTLPPRITSSIPDSGATNVATNNLIEIVFSKQIDTTSFTFTLLPSPGGVAGSWNPGRDTLHVSHAAFAFVTAETVSVTHAADLSGRLLSGRSVITFTTQTYQGPVITMKTQPSSPQTAAGPYLVQAVITDASGKGVKSIVTDSLYYRVNGGSWVKIIAAGIVADTFGFQIPGIGTGLVEYYLRAWDNDGLTAMEPSSGYYSFFVDTVPPVIVSSMPDSGASSVALGSPIRLAFSEPMDTSSFALNISPDPGGVSGVWNNRHDTLNIAHNAFAYATAETIRVAHAEDTLGNLLSGRSVIIFTTLANQGPVITMTTQPSSPQSAAGPYLVRAVISDPAKGGKSMTADTLFYRVSSGTWSSLGPSAANGDTFSFQIPAIDSGLVEYYLQAWDNMGLTALAPPTGYHSFYVDTLPPRITSSDPDSGAAGVAVNYPLTIAFSKPMDTASFAFTVIPNLGGVSGNWNPGHDTLRIVHNPFAYSTAETLRITSARDLPGRMLIGRNVVIFATASNQGPVITMKAQPSSPQTDPGPYLVQAVIIDPSKGGKSIAADSLFYRVRNGTWRSLGAAATIGDTVSFQIPSADSGRIDYCIKAWDNLGLSTLSPSLGLYSFYVDTLHPAISYSQPDSGQVDVSLSDPVRIAFSEPMDTASFSFTVSPDPGGVSGAWNAKRDTFNIAHGSFNYAEEETVCIILAKDLRGNPLIGRNAITFLTPLIIAGSVPDSGASNVLVDAPLTVVFAGPIDTAGFSCTLAPDPGGVMRSWSAGRDTLRMTHNAFTYNTPVTLSIIHASALSGALLSGRNTVTFTTTGNLGPVIVIKAQPSSPQNIPGPYLVQAVITDPAKNGGKGITADSLYYRINSGLWTGHGPVSVSGDTFSFQIPAIDSGTIDYGLRAWDNMGFLTTEPFMGYYTLFVDTINTGVNGRPGDRAYILDLNAAFPNPVIQGRTAIRFSLPEQTDVKLEVFNVLGQKVNTLADGRLEKGWHTVNWNGRDGNGQKLSSGVYVYQLKTLGKIMTKRMTLIR